MQNPLLRNAKTGIFGDLQQRTSHYNRILCAKSLYDCSESPTKQPIYSNVKCKLKNKMEEERKFGNKKLVTSLMEINKRRSSFSNQNYRQPKSLRSFYSLKEENDKIMGDNLDLYRKIVHVNSEIGSKKKWKSRNKVLRKYSRLLENKRQEYLNLDNNFYAIFQKLRQKKKSQTLLKFQSSLQQPLRKKVESIKKKRKFLTEPVDREDNIE